MSDEPNTTLKLVMIGDITVGKSSLAQRFVNDTFQPNKESTMRIAFMNKIIKIEGQEVEIRIWDTAGQEKYKSLVPIYYRGAHGAVLVYDISNPKTLEAVDFWSNELRNLEDPNMPISLVGNKSDLESKRQVSYEDGQERAKKMKAFFLETSAMNNTNVIQLFVETARIGLKYHQTLEKEEERKKSQPSVSDVSSRKLSRTCFLCA